MDVTEEKAEAKSTEQSSKYVLPNELFLPEKYVLPIKFRGISQPIQDLAILADDVWVVTFPKSGTTWLQEAVWLLTHQLDFDKAKRLPQRERSVFVESSCLEANSGRLGSSFENTLQNIDALEKPRVLKSHLLWGRLPKALRDPKSPAKIVYVARNPKDVVVSYFYFYRMMRSEKYHEVAQSWEFLIDMFLNDRVGFGPYWSHVLEFWERRNWPNILFLKYEDMKADIRGELDKLQTFLGVPPLTDDEKLKLADHLSFEKMKNNVSVNAKATNFFRETYLGTNEESNFLRKGKVGDWKDKLSPELVKRLDEWIARNTAGTGYSVE